MKFILAILNTIFLFFFTLFIMPFLNWYQNYFGILESELVLAMLISIFIFTGWIFLTIIIWAKCFIN